MCRIWRSDVVPDMKRAALDALKNSHIRASAAAGAHYTHMKNNNWTLFHSWKYVITTLTRNEQLPNAVGAHKVLVGHIHNVKSIKKRVQICRRSCGKIHWIVRSPIFRFRNLSSFTRKFLPLYHLYPSWMDFVECSIKISSRFPKRIFWIPILFFI